MLFYCFSKLDIIDEFKAFNYGTDSGGTNGTLPNNNGSTSSTLSTIAPPISSEEYSYEDTLTIVNIDSYFKFMNFPLYFINSDSSSNSQFLILLLSLDLGLFLTIILILGCTIKLFNASKNGGMKEGYKILVKFLSFVMLCYFKILLIPMLLTNF